MDDPEFYQRLSRLAAALVGDGVPLLEPEGLEELRSALAELALAAADSPERLAAFQAVGAQLGLLAAVVTPP